MADELKRLAQVQLGTSSATMYTNPGGSTKTIIRHIRVVNTNGSSSRTVALWDGAAATGSNRILPDTTISGGGWGEFEGTIVLDSGRSIWGRCTEAASEVTVTLYGMEVT